MRCSPDGALGYLPEERAERNRFVSSGSGLSWFMIMYSAFGLTTRIPVVLSGCGWSVDRRKQFRISPFHTGFRPTVKAKAVYRDATARTHQTPERAEARGPVVWAWSWGTFARVSTPV